MVRFVDSRRPEIVRAVSLSSTNVWRGDFQGLARNRTDPNDSRLLIVLAGGFRVLKD